METSLSTCFGDSARIVTIVTLACKALFANWLTFLGTEGKYDTGAHDLAKMKSPGQLPELRGRSRACGGFPGLFKLTSGFSPPCGCQPWELLGLREKCPEKLLLVQTGSAEASPFLTPSSSSGRS